MWRGSRGRTILPVLRSILALAGALAAALALSSPAHAAPQWFSGTSAGSYGNTCVGGFPGYGQNTSTSVSYWTDPDAGYPKVGDKYWMRILTGAVGYTCPYGISDINLELLLPEMTGLAIDLASANPDDRVRCFFQGSNGAVTEVTDKVWTAPWDTTLKGKYCDSTKLPSMGVYGYNLGTRLLAQGTMTWITVPVRSFKQLKGMAGTGNTTKMSAPTSSGVNSFVNPFQWVTVFDRPAAISYPAGAESALGTTTATTKGVLDAWYRKGKAYVELGSGAGTGFQVSTQPIDIDGQWPQYTITQEWAELTPGTEYRWRIRFVDEQGVTTSGATRTFKTAGTPPPAGGGGGSTPQPGPKPTPTPDPQPDPQPEPQPQPDPVGGDRDTDPQPQTQPQPAPPAGESGGGATTAAVDPAPAPAPPSPPAPVAGPPANAPGTFALAGGTRVATLAAAKGATVSVTCTRACSVTAKLTIDARTARKLGLGQKARVIATGKATRTKAGALALRLKALANLRTKLARAKALTATLKLTGPGAPTGSAKVTLKR